MSKKRENTIKKFIAMAINLQFILPTVAIAENKKVSFTDGVLIGLNAANTLGQSYIEGMQQAQMQQMSMVQQQSLRQGLRPKLVDPNQVPPIFSQSGCMVIEAKTEKSSDMCEKDMYSPEKALSGYYTAMQGIARDNANEFDNFLTEGNERFTTQGIGCFNKARDQFDATLKARVEMLNKMEADLEQQVKAFKKLAEKDLEDIKKNEAFLTGKPAKYLRDSKLENKFNDPKCNSIFSQGNFKKTAKKGFNGIQELLDQAVNPVGKMGATDLIQKTRDIKKDIRKIADRAAKFAKDNDTLEVDPSNLGIRTTLIDASNKSLKGVLADVQAQAKQEAKKLQKEVGTKISGDSDLKGLIKNIDSNEVDLENSLFNYERGQKNACLNSYLKSNFGGASGFSKKLQDPTISKKLNKETDSYFKNVLVTILNDSEYTMEEKVKMIAKEERSNSRYSFKTGKSMNIKGQKIGASARVKASQMIEIFADNCKQRYNDQKVSNGSSRKDMVNAVRKYSSKRKQLQKTFISKLRSDIISEMENCPSDSTTGVAQKSCNGAMEPSSNKFCLKTANLCARNMLACQDKAQKIIDKTKNDQRIIADRYKANMKSFKTKMISQFSVINKQMEASARQLDGMYQKGSVYNVPVNLSLDLLNNKFLPQAKGFNSSLELEDPEEYLKQAKKDIALLKKSVEKNNKTLIAGLDKERKKYAKNLKKMQGVWEKTKSRCTNLIAKYNADNARQVAEENKGIDERNKKLASACRKVAEFEEHPLGFCGDLSALGDEVGEITQATDNIGSIRGFQEICDEHQSSGSNTNDSSGSNNDKTIDTYSVAQFCKDNSDYKGCDELDKIKKHSSYKDEKIGDLCIAEDVELELADLTSKQRKTLSQKIVDQKYCFSANGKFLSTTETNCDEDKTIKPVNGGEVASNILAKYVENNKSELDQFKSDFNGCEGRKVIKGNARLVRALANVQKQVKAREIQNRFSEMGGVSVAACNSTMDNGVGKSLLGLGEQTTRTLATSGALGM